MQQIQNESLQIASRENFIEIVEILLDSGADPRNFYSYSLRFAAERGHKDVCASLLKRGAVFNPNWEGLFFF